MYGKSLKYSQGLDFYKIAGKVYATFLKHEFLYWCFLRVFFRFPELLNCRIALNTSKSV